MVEQGVTPIVTFTRPPVVEVVAGVSFTGYGQEFGALLAAFWKEMLRAEFPVLQQQPPYTSPEESYGGDPFASGVQLQFGGEFPSPRLWAGSRDGTQLVQIQPDWFAQNWRRVQPSTEYDRWAARRNALSASLGKLASFLDSIGEEQPPIRQCEVTYVNHIDLEGISEGHGGIGSVLRGQDNLSAPFALEQASLNATYLLQTRGERPAGRLYVKLNPALEPSGKPIYVLELTVRGKPTGSDTESALQLLDRGRGAIDTAFYSLTTETMHERWGLEK